MKPVLVIINDQTSNMFWSTFIWSVHNLHHELTELSLVQWLQLSHACDWLRPLWAGIKIHNTTSPPWIYSLTKICKWMRNSEESWVRDVGASALNEYAACVRSGALGVLQTRAERSRAYNQLPLPPYCAAAFRAVSSQQNISWGQWNVAKATIITNYKLIWIRRKQKTYTTSTIKYGE